MIHTSYSSADLLWCFIFDSFWIYGLFVTVIWILWVSFCELLYFFFYFNRDQLHRVVILVDNYDVFLSLACSGSRIMVTSLSANHIFFVFFSLVRYLCFVFGRRNREVTCILRIYVSWEYECLLKHTYLVVGILLRMCLCWFFAFSCTSDTTVSPAHFSVSSLCVFPVLFKQSFLHSFLEIFYSTVASWIIVNYSVLL